MNRLPYPLILLAMLALGALAPPAASAKVMPVAATVCGSDRCIEVSRGPGRLPFELMIPAIDPRRASAPPARPGRWYGVDLKFGPPAVRAEARGFRDEFPVAFLPGPGYVRTGVSPPRGENERGGAVGGTGFRWVDLTSAEIAAYADITEGVEPMPAAALSRGGMAVNAFDDAFSGQPVGAGRGSRASTAGATDGSDAPWGWIALGAGALLALIAAGLAWLLRGRFARGVRHAR
jgi:hypothetical protein